MDDRNFIRQSGSLPLQAEHFKGVLGLIGGSDEVDAKLVEPAAGITKLAAQLPHSLATWLESVQELIEQFTSDAVQRLPIRDRELADPTGHERFAWFLRYEQFGFVAKRLIESLQQQRPEP